MSDTLSQDTLLAGAVRLRQPKSGYRVAIDPVLLAAAARVKPAEQVADFGCGVGAAFLCLANRVPDLTVYGLELNPDLAALAQQNAADNQIRAEIIRGDVGSWPGAPVDHVLMNPPFHDDQSDPSPDPAKDQANRSTQNLLEQWVSAARRTLKPRGRISLIYRADRLDRALSALHPAFQEVEVIPVWPKLGSPAKRVILRARCDVRSPGAILPGLVMHKADGSLTAEARAVLEDGHPLFL